MERSSCAHAKSRCAQEDVSGFGFGSVQVDEQPHARQMDAAGAGVHEEAAPAKGRHFGRSDTELKLMVTFFEQIAETCSILFVCLLWILMHYRTLATKSSTQSRRNVLAFPFESKRKDMVTGGWWLMWRA